MNLEQRLARAFLEEHPSEAARALERMPVEQRAAIVRDLPAATAPALQRMVAQSAAECLSRLMAQEAAPALQRLPLDTLIAILRRMPEEIAHQVIRGLPAETQESLRRVLRSPEGTAGALMDPAVLALPDDITVGEARIRLRRESKGLLHYLFVVGRDGRLVGVLDIPELMRARPRDDIRSVMHQRVERLPAWTPAAAIRVHPGWRSFHAMPVTDDDGRLIGAIRYQTLRRLEQDAESGRGPQGASVAAGALGELFHIGVAGLIEGVASAASPRESRPAAPVAGDERGTR